MTAFNLLFYSYLFIFWETMLLNATKREAERNVSGVKISKAETDIGAEAL